MRDKVRRTRVATCSVRAPMSPSRRHDRSDISWNNAAAFSNLPPTRTTIVCPLWGVPTSNCLCLHCLPVPGRGRVALEIIIALFDFQRFVYSGYFPFGLCWKNSVLKGNLIRVKCILFIGRRGQGIWIVDKICAKIVDCHYYRVSITMEEFDLG